MADPRPSDRAAKMLAEIDKIVGFAVRKGYIGRVAIRKEFNLTDGEARWVIEKLREGYDEEVNEEGELVQKDNYTYDEERDIYTLFTRSGQLVVEGDDIRSLKRAYSNWTGKPQTLREVAYMFPNLSLREIKEAIACLGMIHDSSPFTDEEIIEKTQDELLEDLTQERKITLAKEWEQKQRKEAIKKATLYDLQEVAFEKHRDRLIKDLSELRPDTNNINLLDLHDDTEDGVVAVVIPADIHFGKLADPALTGHNYTLRSARQVVLEHTHKVLSRLAKGYKLDMIHLVVGNDWFHVDTAGGTTTKGTRQDVAGSTMTIHRYGKKLAVEVIEYCKRFAPQVRVSTALSNHDYVAGAGLIDFIEAWYRDDRKVQVDTSLRTRNYYVYGQTLVGIDHGHGAKQKDLPLLMAQEAGADWGSTRFREIFVGHLHHSRSSTVQASLEHTGVRIWTLPSLSATDQWHELKGYVKSIRSLEAHIIHPQEGRIGSVASNVLPQFRFEMESIKHLDDLDD